MKAKKKTINLWLTKAESGIKAAKILIKDTLADMVCFHACSDLDDEDK